MPKAYWITFYREVKDPDKLAAYAKLASPATFKFSLSLLQTGGVALVLDPPTPAA